METAEVEPNDGLAQAQDVNWPATVNGRLNGKPEGDVDLYPRFGPTSEWDTAAGQIIAEEAGCKVVDITTGQSLRYGKPGFANSGFIASRADLDLVEKLRSAEHLKPRS